MLAIVVATLCLADVCTEKVVSDQASSFECAINAPAFIAKWMADEGYTARGYRLAAWGCQYGRRTRV